MPVAQAVFALTSVLDCLRTVLEEIDKFPGLAQTVLVSFLTFVAITAGSVWILFKTSERFRNWVVSLLPGFGADSDASLIAEARSRGRPYFLESVTMLVKISDSNSGKKPKRFTEARSIYAFRHIAPRFAFREYYDTEIPFEHIARWQGSEEEFEDLPFYEIRFEGKPGDRRVAVTGANYEVALPLPPDRKVLFNEITLRSDQEWWWYAVEEDFVGSITILIESDTTSIAPSGQAASILRSKDGSIQRSKPRFLPRSETSAPMISANWRSLKPGDQVGVLLEW